MKEIVKRKMFVKVLDLISVLREVGVDKGIGTVYFTTVSDSFFVCYHREDKDCISCSSSKKAAYYGIDEAVFFTTSQEVQDLLSHAERLVKEYKREILVAFEEVDFREDVFIAFYMGFSFEDELLKVNKFFRELLKQTKKVD